MKKITTVLFACLLSYAAIATGGVNFVKNMTWDQIKAKAAKEKKMIFFDAYTTWCGPCKYLEQSVYTDASVAAYYNSNFINVKFDMEEGEGLHLAEMFEINSYPTLLFFSPEAKLVHKVIGALQADDFINLGKDAKDPVKQYFTLKQKVISREASADDFLNWSEQANELEDNNRGTIASTWLSGQTDILATAELAKTTMLYTDVNEVQLSYLYQEKNKISDLMGWDNEKTETALYRKLFTLAYSKFDPDKTDTKEFEAVITKYEPTKLNYALIDLQLMLLLNRDKDNQKAMQVLIGSIRGTGRISLPEMCALLIDHSPGFVKTDIEQLEKSLNVYTITPGDKGNEWGLYLAQVICYSKLEDLVKAKEFAEKAYRHNNLPESYKPILKESYGLSN